MDKNKIIVERVRKHTNNIVEDTVSGYECNLWSLVTIDWDYYYEVSNVCKNCRNLIKDCGCIRSMFYNVYIR